MGTEFAVGMGSNLGDRFGNLLIGALHLASYPGVTSFRLSGVFETPPAEGARGGNFYNCVMVGEFGRTARELLLACREAEALAGSQVEKGNGPRTLDMDLLFFGSERRKGSMLTIPHPGLRRRRFVLEPLAQVWSGDVPGLDAAPAEMLRECRDTAKISMVIPVPAEGRFWEVGR